MNTYYEVWAKARKITWDCYKPIEKVETFYSLEKARYYLNSRTYPNEFFIKKNTIEEIS